MQHVLGARTLGSDDEVFPQAMPLPLLPAVTALEDGRAVLRRRLWEEQTALLNPGGWTEQGTAASRYASPSGGALRPPSIQTIGT